MIHDGDAEERFLQLLESAPDAIVGVGRGGQIVLVNSQAERTFGYARAELLQSPVGMLLPDGLRDVHRAHQESHFADPTAASMPVSLDLAGLRKDGREFPAEISLSPLGAGDGLIVISIFRDLSERRRAEEERMRLMRERAEAEVANRTKDEFLATISHELRTPLQAILGWVRMLRAGTLEQSVATRALETIERNARVQARMVDDLLEVSRIVNGKVQLESRLVELPLVIDTAIDGLRTVAYARRIRLNTLIDPAVGPVWGDSSRLEQVVWHLVSNAIKFSRDGGKVEVRVECGEKGTARIVVSDTGTGIAPAFIDHIFDRFSRGERGTTAAHGGLWLGLAIARNLVELHGGTIEVESAGESRGAKFTIVLPVLDESTASEAPEPTPRQARPAHASSLDGLRILVVDDEPDTLEIVGATLRHAGAVVTSASSAADAWRAFEGRTPDLLISDLAMPGEDGFQLISRIRSRPADKGGRVPAMALSAYSAPEDRRQALNAGFQLHVAKPIEPHELVRLVQGLVPHQQWSS